MTEELIKEIKELRQSINDLKLNLPKEFPCSSNNQNINPLIRIPIMETSVKWLTWGFRAIIITIVGTAIALLKAGGKL